MKITGSFWFTSFDMVGCVGIVFGEDEVTGAKKAYIGTEPGGDQQSDERRIAEHGAKLTEEMAENIYNIFQTKGRS